MKIVATSFPLSIFFLMLSTKRVTAMSYAVAYAVVFLCQYFCLYCQQKGRLQCLMQLLMQLFSYVNIFSYIVNKKGGCNVLCSCLCSCFPMSIFFLILSTKRVAAMSVDRFFLYPNWASFYKLILSKWSMSCLWMNFFKSFEIIGRIEIGL